MKKNFFIFPLISISTSVWASEDKMICASYYALKWSERVERLRSDKAKHCTLSCLVAKKCQNNNILVLGAVKDVLDLIGPGNSEWQDMKANIQGVVFSTQPNLNCFQSCIKRYSLLIW